MSNEHDVSAAMRSELERVEADLRDPVANTKYRAALVLTTAYLSGQAISSADILREAIDRTWPPLSFHEAWGEAKGREDYSKEDWNRAQRHHEGERHPMDRWLEIVAQDESHPLEAK
jgi:hypothetical protein